MDWERSDSTTFPNTWHVFTKIVSGKDQTFWIQDYTEEYFENVSYYFENGFMKEAVLSKYVAGESKETSEYMRNVSMKRLKAKISLVCLTKEESGEISFVGFNLLDRTLENEGEMKVESRALCRLLEIVKCVSKSRDIFKELNITEYVNAWGLYVLPQYRGLSIGLEILKAREPLCKALGLHTTLTAFTSDAAQKQAYACGFKDFASKSYREIFTERPDLDIPGFVEYDKTFRYMYKRY